MLNICSGHSYLGDRYENLDRFGHISKKSWSLSYLLDGFEIYSPHYVDSLEQLLVQMKELPDELVLEEVINHLSNAISYNHDVKGKASVVFVICAGGKMSILTAGDSRAYLLKSRTRTLDHSLAQQLVDEGKVNPTALYKHPYRKYLKNKLQNHSKIVDVERTDFENIEDILLCSDGIWSCFLNDNSVFMAIEVSGENLLHQAKINRPKNRDNMTLLHLKSSV